jgi:homoserine dehydrogenase
VPFGDVQAAMRNGQRVRLVASVRRRDDGAVDARVEPVALPLSDPLARVDGVMNALTIETDTTTPVTIIGPGAGREQAGQGIFADLIAVVSRA